jgi:hypothetical protein
LANLAASSVQPRQADEPIDHRPKLNRHGTRRATTARQPRCLSPYQPEVSDGGDFPTANCGLASRWMPRRARTHRSPRDPPFQCAPSVMHPGSDGEGTRPAGSFEHHPQCDDDAHAHSGVAIQCCEEHRRRRSRRHYRRRGQRRLHDRVRRWRRASSRLFLRERQDDWREGRSANVVAGRVRRGTMSATSL